MTTTMSETQQVPSAATNQLEVFRATVTQTFVPLTIEGVESGFAGTVSHVGIGHMHVADVAAGPHVVRRTGALIRRSDPGFYKLSLQISGRSVLSQDDRQAVLSPGDFVVYDTTRPYELAFPGSFRMIVLMFPRELLQLSALSMNSSTGKCISGRFGLGATISPFIVGAARQAEACSAQAGSRLADAVVDMLSASFVDERDSTDCCAGQGRHQVELLNRIRDYVEDHLSDPELVPSAIAAAHYISPRYLRKLFEAEGDSVTRWIRTRRLDHCRRDLLRADLSDRSVSAIGASWGLTDAAHFSRLFKAAYGLSPRDYRHHALASA